MLQRHTTSRTGAPVSRWWWVYSLALPWELTSSSYVPWSKVGYIGDGHPTFNRNPYNGYINPYYWVDDHPLLYGNNGSLDPGTYVVVILPETNSKRPQKWWFPSPESPRFQGAPIFRCELLVLGSVFHPYL